MTVGCVVGGRVLLPEGEIAEATVAWDGSTIVALEASGVPAEVDPTAVIDARGRLVLPGIVDIHGDAFERALMPRPGVRFPVDVALAENDGSLVTSGITTSLVSATDSWEPGLRSRDTLRELVARMRVHRSPVDLRLHVRHEVCNTDDFDELVGWLRDGTIAMLSYNDHTPGGTTDEHALSPSPTALGRTGLTSDELASAMAHAAGRRTIGRSQSGALREVAAEAGVPTASHDPVDEADLAADLALGVSIAEFPATIDLAASYREAGVAVLMGAPNIVRGGSHLGLLAVHDAVAAGAVDVLCSDYHHPSLLQAPFVLADRCGIALADAWAMVAAVPAEVAGLDDRGVLAPGQRADIVVVDPPGHGHPARVCAVVAGGNVVLRDDR